MEVLISVLQLDREPGNYIQFSAAPAPLLLSRLIKLLTLGAVGWADCYLMEYRA